VTSFDIQILHEEGIEVDYILISIAGFLDAHTVTNFETKMDELVGAGKNKVVIDMKNLTYISSAGIGAMMGLTQRLRKLGGDLVLLEPSEKVFKILDLLGFTRIFRIASDKNKLFT
jgi:anti-sigma B factor antagonist